MKKLIILILFINLLFLINIFISNEKNQKPQLSICSLTDNWILEKSVQIDSTKNSEDKKSTYWQNNGYKLFYGTWKYSEIISQHGRIGGDEGYENLIGTTVTYTPEYFQGEGEKYVNPTYLIQIYPIIQDNYNQFFSEQKGIEQLLPNSDFFVFVQIVNKPLGNFGNHGFEFIIKDDTTLFAFDYNCIYKLTRESYIDNYSDYIYTSEYLDYPTYQERY